MIINRFIFILSFVSILQLEGEDTVYISLGRSCQPAVCLRELRVRTVAYPFDWLISHYHSVYSALENDFADFFTRLSLNYDKTAAVDFYGLEFRNVWQYNDRLYNRELDLINWEEQIPKVAESFRRKIERFREVCNSDQKVVFIRWEDIDQERSRQLRDLIRSKYPYLSFILMVVKHCEEFQCPWGEEDIKNFSFPYNDLKSWKEALEEVRAGGDFISSSKK